MRILCSGGASYIGSWLVPQLLAEGHKVTVYDTLMFGDGFLPKDNYSLTILRADVRNASLWRQMCMLHDTVIYLASISSEMMCQKNPELAQSINVDCFGPNVEIAKAEGIKRFIYASSVAGYGSSETSMKEDAPLEPTTIYGKGKKACEDILKDFQSEDFTTIVTRSASVCGYSPRIRLDLTINRMVHDACRKGLITVEGGNQVRSHVHMKDICEFYKLLIKAPKNLIEGQAFNVVAENQSVMESAKIVSIACGSGIEVKERVDDRSYSVDGEKAKSIGFFPTLRVQDAVLDLKYKFDSGYWKDSLTNPIYQNMT
jgi:nucleoside-diphosphate-sugar epimerase